MPSKNKIRGNALEREIVEAFTKKGMKAKRAWGSNGQALGEHEEVDVLIDYSKVEDVAKPLKIQAKRKKKLPDWMGFTKHVDAVCVREDRGKIYIMFELDEFLKRFL